MKNQDFSAKLVAEELQELKHGECEQQDSRSQD